MSSSRSEDERGALACRQCIYISSSANQCCQYGNMTYLYFVPFILPMFKIIWSSNLYDRPNEQHSFHSCQRSQSFLAFWSQYPYSTNSTGIRLQYSRRRLLLLIIAYPQFVEVRYCLYESIMRETLFANPRLEESRRILNPLQSFAVYRFD